MSDETRKVELKFHPIIEQLVADPASPPEVTQLVGYLGKSTRAGHVRLYASLDLDEYTDVPEAAIRHAAEVPDTELEHGGTRLWIEGTAEVVHEVRTTTRSEARFLEGAIADANLRKEPEPTAAAPEENEDFGAPETWGDGCLMTARTCAPWVCRTLDLTCAQTRCQRTCGPLRTCAATCPRTECGPTCEETCPPTECGFTCPKTRCGPNCVSAIQTRCPSCAATCPRTQCGPTECAATCVRTECALTCVRTCPRAGCLRTLDVRCGGGPFGTPVTVPTPCPTRCGFTCMATCPPTRCNLTCMATCPPTQCGPTCAPTCLATRCNPTCLQTCPATRCNVTCVTCPVTRCAATCLQTCLRTRCNPTCLVTCQATCFRTCICPVRTPACPIERTMACPIERTAACRVGPEVPEVGPFGAGWSPGPGYDWGGDAGYGDDPGDYGEYGFPPWYGGDDDG